MSEYKPVYYEDDEIVEHALNPPPKPKSRLSELVPPSAREWAEALEVYANVRFRRGVEIALQKRDK